MFTSISPTIDSRRKVPAAGHQLHILLMTIAPQAQCSTFPTNFAIHPSSSYLSELTGISPQCHCFHLFPIFALLQENWEKSSQVKQTRAAGVGSAHIQTSEASEAIRNFSCCKDAWHPRKSGPGLRWLGVSLPLEFSVVIPDVHLISISSYFHTCQSQGLAVSCVRRKLLCTFFQSKGEFWGALKKEFTPRVIWPEKMMLQVQNAVKFKDQDLWYFPIILQQ